MSSYLSRFIHQDGLARVSVDLHSGENCFLDLSCRITWPDEAGDKAEDEAGDELGMYFNVDDHNTYRPDVRGLMLFTVNNSLPSYSIYCYA